jgi:hypothetical protein
MWTADNSPRETVYCPICGHEMTWGVWAVAEIPGTDGDLVEDLAYRCSMTTGGCEAILLPPAPWIDGRLDLKGESGN